MATVAPEHQAPRVPNGCPLTTREFQVVSLLAAGMTCGQIAHAEGRAANTVRTQLHTSYRKLGATNATQAVMACMRAGWIRDNAPPPPDGVDDLVVELDRLVVAVRGRRETTLTPAQRIYLATFEQHLYARTDEQSASTRVAMDDALGTLIGEAGIRVRDTRKQRDLIGLIASRIENAR